MALLRAPSCQGSHSTLPKSVLTAWEQDTLANLVLVVCFATYLALRFGLCRWSFVQQTDQSFKPSLALAPGVWLYLGIKSKRIYQLGVTVLIFKVLVSWDRKNSTLKLKLSSASVIGCSISSKKWSYARKSGNKEDEEHRVESAGPLSLVPKPLPAPPASKSRAFSIRKPVRISNSSRRWSSYGTLSAACEAPRDMGLSHDTESFSPVAEGQATSPPPDLCMYGYR